MRRKNGIFVVALTAAIIVLTIKRISSKEEDVSLALPHEGYVLRESIFLFDCNALCGKRGVDNGAVIDEN